MTPQTLALILAVAALLGTAASLAAPRLAPTYPRLAIVLRVVAALAVDLRAALTAGQAPALPTGDAPKPPGATS